MRAIQLKSALKFQETSRPRLDGPHSVGHDKLGFHRSGLWPVTAFQIASTMIAPITATTVETMKPC
jgi:hypothetical protein